MASWDRYLDSLGLLNLTWGNVLLILVGLGGIALALRRSWQPRELLLLGLGLVLANLPGTGIASFIPGFGAENAQASGALGVFFHFGISFWSILPPLLFLGLGAATDLTPIIANPRTLALGAVGVLVVLGAFWIALATGLFGTTHAAAVGLAGAADGPLAIYSAAWLAPDRPELVALIGATAYLSALVASKAHSPLTRRLTTLRERTIIMPRLREVSRFERLLFPCTGLVVIALLVPAAAPIAGMFLVGNVLRENGLTPRLAATAGNGLLNVATILLVLALSSQLSADRVFQLSTLAILLIGVGAALLGSIAGVVVAKGINLFLDDKLNPLIGAAALAPLPLLAQAVDAEGRRADPNNQLLPHALACNAAALLAAISLAAVFIAVAP